MIAHPEQQIGLVPAGRADIAQPGHDVEFERKISVAILIDEPRAAQPRGAEHGARDRREPARHMRLEHREAPAFAPAAPVIALIAIGFQRQPRSGLIHHPGVGDEQRDIGRGVQRGHCALQIGRRQHIVVVEDAEIIGIARGAEQIAPLAIFAAVFRLLHEADATVAERLDIGAHGVARPVRRAIVADDRAEIAEGLRAQARHRFADEIGPVEGRDADEDPLRRNADSPDTSRRSASAARRAPPRASSRACRRPARRRDIAPGSRRARC